MKKYVMFTLVAALSISITKAQKLSAAQVPAAVKNSFATAYPNQAVKWEKEKDKYEAGFKKNGTDMSVLYTTAGEATETETNIKPAELPAAVLSYLKTNMPGKRITEAAKITNAAGVVTFEAEVAGKDMIFDDKGKFIKKMKG